MPRITLKINGTEHTLDVAPDMPLLARPEFRQAAAFFNRFRWLTLCGFYTTEAGRKDVGYIGNVPLAHFPGATDEQLAYLGLK